MKPEKQKGKKSSTVEVTISMGASGPRAEPHTAKVPAGGKVEWVPADEDRWWIVIMKADKKSPFSNDQRKFKGKGKDKPGGAGIKKGLKKGNSYDYWIIYQDEAGQPQVKDPKIMIDDPSGYF